MQTEHGHIANKIRGVCILLKKTLGVFLKDTDNTDNQDSI